MFKRCVPALLAALLSFGAHAAWPEKSIRIVVPYPPGGTTDILTRLVAQKLSDALKQPVVVDNRAGGAAMIGSDIVAKAAPDGYTLLSTGAGPHIINVSLFPKIPYDPLKDFAPITLMSINPLLMVVPASLPVNTAQEFIAWAKENKGRANYCSIGAGSPSHLAAELFKSTAGVEMTHIPYAGSGPAIIAAIGGVCSVLFDSVLSSGPHVKAGKLRVFAVGTTKRLPELPDVPTVAEQGYPGFETVQWYGLNAPAKVPAAIIKRLADEAGKAAKSKEVQDRFAGDSTEEVGSTAAEYAEFIKKEQARWSVVVKTAKIKVD